MWGGPVDPWFRLPLWLQAPYRGEVVWAFNERHLAVLRSYVAADPRERTPGGYPSMLERLPEWLTGAKNRKQVLAVLDALAQR